MADTADVRADLAAAVGTVDTNLNSYAYARDSITVPAAEVTPGEYDPRFVMGQGKTTRDFIVIVYGGRTDEESSQVLLDGYCDMTGSASVIAAIQADASLNGGGTADYAVVTNVSELLVVPKGDIAYLAHRLTVEVCF